METEETKLFFIYKSVSVFGACRKTQGISRRGGAADILTPVSVHSPGEPDKMVSIEISCTAGAAPQAASQPASPSWELCSWGCWQQGSGHHSLS